MLKKMSQEKQLSFWNIHSTKAPAAPRKKELTDLRGHQRMGRCVTKVPEKKQDPWDKTPQGVPEEGGGTVKRRGLEVVRGLGAVSWQIGSLQGRGPQGRIRRPRGQRSVRENLAKILEKDDSLEEDTKLAVDKMCRASQSNHTAE